MSPITSFTTSLGHNGRIDIFALSDPQGLGAMVWRMRQKTAGGDWSPGWIQEEKPGPGAAGLRSILDPEQHGHVLAYAEDAHLWFKQRGPNDGFPTWEALGVPAFDPVTIDPQAEQIPDDVWSFIFMCGAAHADGRIDVVGTVNDIGDSRDVFYRSRPAGGTVWADWERLEDNGFDGDIVAAVAGDDGLDVVTPVDFIVAIGVQEIDMSYRRRGPDGTWTPWALLGRPQGGFTDDVTPVLILGPGGLELFAVSATNVIWHNSQTTIGSWSGWASLGDAGGAITGIAVAAGADGGLDLCATLKDDTVAHRRKDGLGGPWSAWTSLGRPDTSAIADPALILDSNGCLNLLLSRPSQEGLITLRQEVQNGPFTKGPAVPALPSY